MYQLWKQIVCTDIPLLLIKSSMCLSWVPIWCSTDACALPNRVHTYPHGFPYRFHVLCVSCCLPLVTRVVVKGLLVVNLVHIGFPWSQGGIFWIHHYLYSTWRCHILLLWHYHWLPLFFGVEVAWFLTQSGVYDCIWFRTHDCLSQWGRSQSQISLVHSLVGFWQW